MKLHALNRQRLRYQHHIRISAVMAAAVIIFALAIYGAYMASVGFFTQEARIAEARAKTTEAEADTQKALNYIQGKGAELEIHGDYAYKYTVVKELVQLTKSN